MGYMFLGKVVEAASGKKYDDFIINDVLRPYGILDMHIGRSFLSDKRTNEVRYYEAEESQLIPCFDGSGRLVPKPYGGNPIELLGAAGGWIASSIELAKLLVMVDGFRNVPDMIPGYLVDQMVVNKDFRGPLGWKTVKKNGDWIRTGSMAGTSAIMKRQSNGFGWVIIINSSSWKGPRLPAYVDYMMRQIEKKITHWPGTDLFKYEPPQKQIAKN
jgi:CubicO group peptidase (beta-lactamase class C family)